MRSFVRLLFLMSFVFSISDVTAAPLFDPPASVRFSQVKLARITAFFEKEIANQKIPGAVVLIQQHGKPVYETYLGVRDVRTQLPMTPDTIFRLHSLTKPLTSFAAMLLVDDGKLSVDDPVSKYIPEFATTKVGHEREIGGDKALAFTPLARPITVRDLLLHISGLTYGFYGDNLARKTVGASNIYAGDFDNAEFARRVARLPLAEQPGKLWDYGLSSDVLGRIIEVASGQSLFAFQQQRIFAPLGMTNTVYFLTGAEQQKLVANPMPSDADFKVGLSSPPDLFRRFEAGGSGLNSSAADMRRFVQMVLDGGAWNGKLLMKPATYAAMTTDHIGPQSGIARDYFYFPGDGFGFGYGFGVRTDPGKANPPLPGSIGELKWDGASGCYFFIDRRQDFFVLLLQQSPSERQRIQTTLKRLVYEALE